MEEEFEENSSEWLLSVLKEVQLDQFYVRIRDHLQISRISHFEYVTPEDLEKVKQNVGFFVGINHHLSLW